MATLMGRMRTSGALFSEAWQEEGKAVGGRGDRIVTPSSLKSCEK